MLHKEIGTKLAKYAANIEKKENWNRTKSILILHQLFLIYSEK